MAIDTQDIVEALDSEDARQLLALASREPMSADDLEENLDVSLTTVYRQTEELVEVGFLREETEITTDGNQYTTFMTTVRNIEFTITRGEFRVDVQFRDDMVDRFSRLWRSLKGPPT